MILRWLLVEVRVYHEIRWTEQKLGRRLNLIASRQYRRRLPLPSFRFLALDGPQDPPPVAPEVDDRGWEIVAPESYWGRWQQNFVMRARFSVPSEWPTESPAALFLPLGVAGSFSHPEALAYLDGQAVAACDRHHQEIVLPDIWRDGREHVLALHGWTGNRESSNPAQPYMATPAVVLIDQPTRDFVALARVALGAVALYEPHNPARDRLLNALDAAFKALDLREPLGDDFYASVPGALTLLRDGIAGAGAPLDVDVISAGHAHIDVAWLWTLGQTRHKAGRTFQTVMRLMDQFPGYCFTQSQPQLYEFVRQDYPELFAAIQRRVAEGRWEPIGGMWVEADCNISGAESLARQFLLGRRFFREHFGEGAETPVLWLPDVFGYAWALPQLIKQAGLEYFFTIKIGWSQYNRLPYDSFWWQGLDGTRVLTHFSTTPEEHDIHSRATYNAAATPLAVYGTWLNSQHKESQRTFLMSYGYGDGGGGPTREMLENIRVMADLPGMPRTQFGRVGDFFRRLEAESGAQLPVWNGELYLELHRGTYTTQSRNKRANRKSEFLLHDAEFLAVLASLLDSTATYPAEALDEAWHTVCLNQFHDIIPGSSIGAVYEESQAQYQGVFRTAIQIRDEALQRIATQLGGDILLANPIAFPREDLVFWPGTLADDQHLVRPDGSVVPAQAVEGGLWLAPGTLPPLSVTPLTVASGKIDPPQTGLEAAPDHLENAFVRVEFNRAGDITRIYDRVNRREVLPAGALANQFQAFEDRPLNWDAWDIDIFYDDRMWLSEPAESIEVVEAGPLRATLKITRRILNSPYEQYISLACNSPRLDITTTIDWRERSVLLKAAFPVDVLAPVATYEIQYGNVQRPTHRNTSWDWARFEVAAQKWVDLSEGDYGVSLLNDCKYGHDIRDNVIRISLLRGPSLPDPQADLGSHTFTYSLLPHSGNWERTIPAAYALNDPVVVARGTGRAVDPASAALEGMVRPDRPNIVIETIKQAEDGRGVIVRFYEACRQRGPLTLTTAFPLAEAWQTDLLEEDQARLEVDANHVALTVRPYQIVTLRLIPA